MRTNTLLRKLSLDRKEFITSTELKAYCKSLKLNYRTSLRSLLSRGYLIRIFRGIFYVKSPEELNLGRKRYNHLELVAKGLRLKNVDNWYFGLHTALKLNNMTHEHFSVEEVVNDSLFRPRPMKIAGYSFRFVKISPSLLGFGVVEEGDLRHSDPEKTLLDFIYLWRYNGVPAEKIVTDLSDWSKGASRKKLAAYSGHYPETVSQIARKVVA